MCGILNKKLYKTREMKNKTIFIDVKDCDSLIEYLVFITNLKPSRSSLKGETTQKHHVFPKSLGGNIKDNLIELSLWEHLIAHKFLSYALDSKGMNFAYYQLAKIQYFPSVREAYFRWVKDFGGENHHAYKDEKIRLYKPERGIVEFTRLEAKGKLGFDSGTIPNLINGKTLIAKGWIIVKEEKDIKVLLSKYKEYQKVSNRKGKSNHHYNDDTFTFYHDDYAAITTTVRGLCLTYSLPRESILPVANGTNTSYKGWRITKDSKSQIGSKHSRSIKEKFHFFHPEHGDRYCLPSELSREFEGLAAISKVANGKQKSMRGWRLKK